MTTSPPQTSRKWCGKEAGHVLLHPDQRGRECRGILEVEAESVALTLIWTKVLRGSSLKARPLLGGCP